ncbi:hypothetical protein COV81_00540 [Candidatus Peregrinibacteria bacterium CG11_big_fil_rev_8_21_14_0_20_41_10]|nr:MAG: hypothetical protein COV81_00540 [Candidatus Peregrinibacteria bacterium CG11_big_fil_rev_8_21_14_0_20_41_10]PIZ74301.1 MAG: hypothetical protein COY06_04365 [Candidatus Peregrinibacteria bacterium CG_4_10_14_0_2_um_filter_41_8]PJC38174.1 MAG: hypothetical protein CO045_01660 [Candidatus Peregrinibacteria bacterium CG_4_9_14_0_2_um_filter_41_14]
MRIGIITNTGSLPTLLANELKQANHVIFPYHINLTSIPTHVLQGLELIILAVTNIEQAEWLIKSIKSLHKIKIIVTGPNVTLINKSQLIKAGADYYLNYPNESKLIHEVIHWLQTSAFNHLKHLTYKDLVLDPNMHTLARQKKFYRLPNKEYLLMEHFLKYPNQIHSKRTLMETIWDMNADTNSTTVETHICNLRKKMDTEFPEKRLHTIPYSGYILK